jgi:hypothetical protein
MAWHGMAWYGIALHCIALHCIASHRIALHCMPLAAKLEPLPREHSRGSVTPQPSYRHQWPEIKRCIRDLNRIVSTHHAAFHNNRHDACFTHDRPVCRATEHGG